VQLFSDVSTFVQGLESDGMPESVGEKFCGGKFDVSRCGFSLKACN
jgi:hypothetical protein